MITPINIHTFDLEDMIERLLFEQGNSMADLDFCHDRYIPFSSPYSDSELARELEDWP